MPSLEAFHLSLQHLTLEGAESQPPSKKSFRPGCQAPAPGRRADSGAPSRRRQPSPGRTRRPRPPGSAIVQARGCSRGRHCRLLPAGAGRGGALGAHPVNSGWSPPRSRPGSSAPATRSPGALAHLADSILFPPPALPTTPLPRVPRPSGPGQPGPTPPYSACSLATQGLPCLHKYMVPGHGAWRGIGGNRRAQQHLSALLDTSTSRLQTWKSASQIHRRTRIPSLPLSRDTQVPKVTPPALGVSAWPAPAP